LSRFRTAQDSPDTGFDAALAEIRTGGKRGHWIWHIFPQLFGLGRSASSRFYAIDGVAEAADYLRDPLLRSRLHMIATAVAEQLGGAPAVSLRTLMGSDIDARKLVSSLTLWGGVARKLHAVEGLAVYGNLARVAEAVLAAAATQGYPPCSYTLERLRE
jgi:uncharacterized protein (DUF1810 family)